MNHINRRSNSCLLKMTELLTFSMITLFSNFAIADTFESLSQNQSTTTQGISLEGDCKDCGIKSPILNPLEVVKFGQNLTYTCSKSTDYIGRAISSSKSEIVRKLANQPLQQTMIKSTCTKQAMDKIILPSESFRGSCITGGSDGKVPCVSQSYHRLMHNSLDLISRCVKNYYEMEAPENRGRYNDLLQDILGKLTLESNLHLNAVSPGNYSGPGQLGFGSISDVNDSMKNKKSMYSYLKNHADGACRDLAPLLAAKMNPASGACEKISLDKNHPVLNLLYTFNYRMVQRSQLMPLFNSKLIQDRFAGEEREELFNIFMQKINTWAYNPGAGGIRWRARTALLKMPKGAIKNSSDIANLLENIFTEFTGRKDPKICEGKTVNLVPNMENGCYMVRLKKKANELSESVGGLSCINS